MKFTLVCSIKANSSGAHKTCSSPNHTSSGRQSPAISGQHMPARVFLNVVVTFRVEAQDFKQTKILKNWTCLPHSLVQYYEKINFLYLLFFKTFDNAWLKMARKI